MCRHDLVAPGLSLSRIPIAEAVAVRRIGLGAGRSWQPNTLGWTMRWRRAGDFPSNGVAIPIPG
jgi:hypothetical protein